MGRESLENWMSQAERHWKQFQPKRYKRLKQNGMLREELRAAAQSTADELDRMGAYNSDQMGYLMAWEQVRETWLFPKEEPEVTQEMEAEDNGLAELFMERNQLQQMILHRDSLNALEFEREYGSLPKDHLLKDLSESYLEEMKKNENQPPTTKSPKPTI